MQSVEADAKSDARNLIVKPYDLILCAVEFFQKIALGIQNAFALQF